MWSNLGRDGKAENPGGWYPVPGLSRSGHCQEGVADNQAGEDSAVCLPGVWSHLHPETPYPENRNQTVPEMPFRQDPERWKVYQEWERTSAVRLQFLSLLLD